MSEVRAIDPREVIPITSRTLAEALTRPYPVTAPMIALLLLVPCYIFIAAQMPGRTLHAPELAIDRAWPLIPAWSLVYGTMYLFLIVLPVLVVRQERHIRHTFLAYLTVWITAYLCFVLYPTRAPRPAQVPGDGFAAWGLRFLYAADPPYNCFPSLHVAHSFISALTCYRVHRGVGVAAMAGASLVALSTLFTRQHYVLDVAAGVLLAWAAYVVFLRNCGQDGAAALDRRVAPAVAAWTGVMVGAAFACAWFASAVAHL